MVKTDKPDFQLELGIALPPGIIIGVDEVGRGALAGPVVAGAVCIEVRGQGAGKSQRNDWLSLGIDDSKRLKVAERERLAEVIQEKAEWAVGESDVETINNLGIVVATHLAMKQAVGRLLEKIGETEVFVLVDGLPVGVFEEMGLRHLAIVRGDQKSISIAAASVVAKVYRDRLMTQLAQDESNHCYHWGENKGYGTKVHLDAIARFGASSLHRQSFVKHPRPVD